MDESGMNTRQALEAEVIDRAMKDEAFRQELVRDPRGVLARELGMQIPEHVNVQVLEENPTTVYVVLPQPVRSGGTEVADAELEDVAGGVGPPREFASGSAGGECACYCTIL